MDKNQKSPPLPIRGPGKGRSMGPAVKSKDFSKSAKRLLKEFAPIRWL